MVTGEGVRLHAKVALVRPALAMASAGMWHSQDPEVYRRYLDVMYPMSQATVSLLRFARSHCLARPTDPLSAPLERYFASHIGEERAHDRWVAADLAALGADPVAAGCWPPSMALTDLIGAQYHLVAAVHPVALLGYIAVLQSDTPGSALVEHARALAGNNGAVTALSRHARLGGAPLALTYALLDTLDLPGELRAVVGLSALRTAQRALLLFAEIAGEQPRPGFEAVSWATPAVDMSDPELALLAEINRLADALPDVLAHSADIVGGLFL
jgi:hypothetical protein